MRPFLALAGAMGLAIIFYMFSPYVGTGGYFPQRYYTVLFPLVALGLAGLLERKRRPVIALASLAATWTLCLGLYSGSGFGLAEERGASQLPEAVLKGKVTPGVIAYNLYHASNFRILIPDPFREPVATR